MDWPDRWNHITKVLERNGPFAHEDFSPGPQTSLYRRYSLPTQEAVLEEVRPQRHLHI